VGVGLTIERARELRKNPGEPERRMWFVLYTFRQQGYHFRRQVQVGPYYADFACHHAAVVIEVDGDTHGTDAARAYDARRDAYFHKRGYEVLRFLE
jgi:very-short-patch-repair endonuclease